MAQIDTPALNKKLAEWAGFKRGIADSWHLTEPHYSLSSEPPDFTQSLNACFKWLVPKLGLYEIIFSAKASVNGYVCQLIWHSKDPNRVGMHDHITECGETYALALCRAIERLIDG